MGLNVKATIAAVALVLSVQAHAEEPIKRTPRDHLTYWRGVCDALRAVRKDNETPINVRLVMEGRRDEWFMCNATNLETDPSLTPVDVTITRHGK